VSIFKTNEFFSCLLGQRQKQKKWAERFYFGLMDSEVALGNVRCPFWSTSETEGS